MVTAETASKKWLIDKNFDLRTVILSDPKNTIDLFCSIWGRYSPLKWPFLQRPPKDLGLSCKWWQWIHGEILMCFLKRKGPKSDHWRFL